MNAIKFKSIFAPVITVILSMGAIAQASADNILYPGSMCSFEHRGTVGTLDKQSGHMSTTAHDGTIVTCPIPQGAPFGDATHNPITVTVNYIHDYRYSGEHRPIRCMLRSTMLHNGELHKTDSQIESRNLGERQPGEVTGEFAIEQFQVSVLASAALRCRIHPGTKLGGYRVESAQTRGRVGLD